MSEAKVLIVDDEPGIVNSVQPYLAREGYVVHTAQDGPSALRVARAHCPDLVILDGMLPGMDGLEVLRRQGRGRRAHRTFAQACRRRPE